MLLFILTLSLNLYVLDWGSAKVFEFYPIYYFTCSLLLSFPYEKNEELVRFAEFANSNVELFPPFAPLPNSNDFIISNLAASLFFTSVPTWSEVDLFELEFPFGVLNPTRDNGVLVRVPSN